MSLENVRKPCASVALASVLFLSPVLRAEIGLHTISDGEIKNVQGNEHHEDHMERNHGFAASNVGWAFGPAGEHPDT